MTTNGEEYIATITNTTTERKQENSDMTTLLTTVNLEITKRQIEIVKSTEARTTIETTSKKTTNGVKEQSEAKSQTLSVVLRRRKDGIYGIMVKGKTVTYIDGAIQVKGQIMINDQIESVNGITVSKKLSALKLLQRCDDTASLIVKRRCILLKIDEC